MKKKNLYQRLLSGALAAVMLATLAGCSSDEPSGSQGADPASEPPADVSEDVPPADSGEPVYGGSVTLYWTDDIDAYYDPAIGDTVSWNLFLEGLWSYDVTSGFAAVGDGVPSSALKGQLAESWTVDEEASTLTVTLRDDVYFQTLDPEYDYYGGRQLVASDVKWSYDRLTGLGSGYDEPIQTESNWAGLLSMVTSIEAPDDQTVVFHLTSADEVTVENFMTQFVKIGGPEWDELTAEQQGDYHYACGTGPYTVSELQSNQKVVLTKNENYYDYDARYPENKLPYLDQITFLYIADSTNIVTQFTSGGLDAFGSNKTNLINDSEMAQLAATMDASQFYVNSIASSQPEFMVMKCNQAPFDDIKVRQAMQLAIDMETIHTSYLNLTDELTLSALWNPVTTEWSTADSWSDELLAEYSYDPERAKQLLTEAGYPDGFEVTVVISADNDPDLWALACEYWAAIGVTVKLESVSNFMEAKTIGNDANDPRNCGSAGAGAVGSITAAINQTVDGGWAAGMWNGDEEYSATLNGMNTVKTLEEQAELALQADQMYAEGHWVVNLTGMRALNYYYNSRLQGVPENCNFYSGKAANTLLAGMWVTDGQ